MPCGFQGISRKLIRGGLRKESRNGTCLLGGQLMCGDGLHHLEVLAASASIRIPKVELFLDVGRPLSDEPRILRMLGAAVALLAGRDVAVG